MQVVVTVVTIAILLYTTFQGKCILTEAEVQQSENNMYCL